MEKIIVDKAVLRWNFKNVKLDLLFWTELRCTGVPYAVGYYVFI